MLIVKGHDQTWVSGVNKWKELMGEAARKETARQVGYHHPEGVDEWQKTKEYRKSDTPRR